MVEKGTNTAALVVFILYLTTKKSRFTILWMVRWTILNVP